MNRIFNSIYPFISITIMEFGVLINNMKTFADCFVFILQISIGIFTIYKLYKDVKSKKFKNIETTEKQVKKQHPILVYLLTFLKNRKNE